MEKERAGKREQYVALFSRLPEERRLPLSDEQYLLTFGAGTGHRNSIAGSGLHLAIDGVRHAYDCFDPRFREYAHVRWSIKYDPDDLGRVLAVNEDASLRFILERKHVQPMAIVERVEGDTGQLARVRQFNRELEDNIAGGLARVDRNIREFFAAYPELDVTTRSLLCDSHGQHKDHKPTRRLGQHDIDDVKSIPVNSTARPVPAEDAEGNVYNFY
jgi:hypothetical protein